MVIIRMPSSLSPFLVHPHAQQQPRLGRVVKFVVIEVFFDDRKKKRKKGKHNNKPREKVCRHLPSYSITTRKFPMINAGRLRSSYRQKMLYSSKHMEMGTREIAERSK